MKCLLEWQKAQNFPLPWRKTRDPYCIWVSEVMLQQTQVLRVIDFYTRFIKTFPTVFDLAKAEWENFLPLWRGLGFYSRGKNMLATARLIANQYGGHFPEDEKKLKQLPGIGPYTAAAISAFAFHHNVPAIDTNFLRLFSRFYHCSAKEVSLRADKVFSKIPDSWKLNGAIMDLGREICKSHRVLCLRCPLAKKCAFVKNGNTPPPRTPKKTKKKKSQKPIIDVAVACIHHEGKYLIARQSEKKGGKWEFVGGKRKQKEDWRHCIKREVMEEIGVEISARPPFLETLWEEEKCMWRLRFARCQILSGEVRCREHEELRWIFPNELEKYDFPKANGEMIKRLQKMRKY